jgi:hypothetical protein
MKHVILLCLSLAALASIAQTCKISGTINDHSVKEVKNGKVVNPNAEHPGSREKIYAQPDKIL